MKFHTITTIIWIILAVFMAVCFCIGFGSATECNADLSQGGDSCVISSSLTLNGTYIVNMNGSKTVGAIRFSGNDRKLDCNGSIIIGNLTNGLIGLYLSSQTGASIINCTFMNYDRAMRIANTNGSIIDSHISNNTEGIEFQGGYSGFSIINNTFYNNTYSSIIFFSASVLSGIVVDGNNFNVSSQAIKGEVGYSSDNITVKNNIFNQMNSITYIPPVWCKSGSNWNIDNNIFNGNKRSYSYGIYSFCNDTIIRNNQISYVQYPIYSSGSVNLTILNNTIFNVDEGTVIADLSDNVIFLNNTIRNTTMNYDTYNVGIKIINSSNVRLEGNNWSELATAGVLSQGGSNISIIGNYFDFIPLSQRGLYSANDGDEPRCAIQSTKRFRGFYNQWGNDNLTILDNVFDTDTPCYLHLENQTQLTHDLTSYWHSGGFVSPDIFSGKYEYYIPSYYNNLSGWNGSSVYYEIVSDTGGAVKYTSYYINKDYQLHKNKNQTSNMNIIFYNLTSALVYNTNGSVYCGGLITGDCNITLNPNNSSYVLDNFNLAEGAPRENSPLSISGLGKSRTITSTLVDNVAVPVIISYTGDCTQVNKITFGSQTYSGEQATNLCNSLSSGATIIIESGSNSLVFEEGTTSMSKNILKLVIGFVSLFVVICAAMMLMVYIKDNGMPNQNQIITYFIIMLFLVILGGALISYIYGVM